MDFFYQVMILCARVRVAPFTKGVKFLAGGQHFDIKKIVANKGHYGAVGVKGILPEHGPRREPG